MNSEWSHRLVDCDLFYVWAGRGRMRLRLREVGLHPGVCIWMRPGVGYAAEHSAANPLGVTYIHFTPLDSEGRECLSDEFLPEEFHQVADLPFFSMVAEKLVRLQRRQHPASAPGREAANSEQSQTLLRALVNELHSATQARDSGLSLLHQEQIEQQIARIHELPAEAPTVATLARELSLSLDHYSRVFRRVAGTSPRELMQEARLDRACRLLAETPLSMSEIADQAGYCDQYQFSRLFKHRMGLSPSRWRKNGTAGSVWPPSEPTNPTAASFLPLRQPPA